MIPRVTFDVELVQTRKLTCSVIASSEAVACEIALFMFDTWGTRYIGCEDEVISSVTAKPTGQEARS